MSAAERNFSTMRKSLAANLSRLRLRASWTQQQAAGAMGLDVKHLQKLEYAELNPSLRTLAHAATAFGVTVAKLLAPARSGPPSRPVGRPPAQPKPKKRRLSAR